MQVIEAHNGLATRSGLPQRSFASSIVAHAVLGPLDDELAIALEGSKVAHVRRWMDDISAEGVEDALYGLLITLQERARQIGLELNVSKTHLRPCAEGAVHLWMDDLREIDVQWRETIKDTYTGETDFLPDLDQLERIQSQILDDPRAQLRPVVSAVLTSLTKYGSFDRAPEWLFAAHHFPASAERLGPYLRGAIALDALSSSSVGEWFGTYDVSDWGKLEWSTANLALAFPLESLPGQVVDVFSGWLASSDNLQKVATAAQRLCIADPTFGRRTIMGRMDRTNDPLLLRCFALGLLTAGGSQPDAENALNKDRRNILLRHHLDNAHWKAPAFAGDFLQSPPEPDDQA